jgi:coiled-coil domain-containing protein 130
MVLDDEETKEKRLTNPMFHLEKIQQDKEVAAAAVPRLTQLTMRQDILWRDHVSQSAKLRSLFRQEKLLLKQQRDEKEAFRQKFALDAAISIPDEQLEDIEKALKAPFKKRQEPSLAQLVMRYSRRRRKKNP